MKLCEDLNRVRTEEVKDFQSVSVCLGATAAV